MFDRLEIGARFAHLGFPPARGTAGFPTPVTVEVTDRSRQFISGLVAYHFRRLEAIRPFVGIGSGRYLDSENVRCEPVACAGIAGLPDDGRRRIWKTDAILMAGVSGQVASHWVLRGGVVSHRFANDENSTTELFAAIGYRFRTR